MRPRTAQGLAMHRDEASEQRVQADACGTTDQRSVGDWWLSPHLCSMTIMSTVNSSPTTMLSSSQPGSLLSRNPNASGSRMAV